MTFLFISVFLYPREDKFPTLDQYDILSVVDSIPLPVFSVPEGIYDQPFTLEIQAPAGYDIFYTIDGSIPSIYSLKYKNEINVNLLKNPNKNILFIPTSFKWRPPRGQQNHSAVFRARCFKAGVGYGKTTNVIYSLPSIQQHQGFQVAHIFMEADSLFSREKGIYVLGKKYYSKKTMAEINQSPVNIRWYEYPANYHKKGIRWTRPAELIMMDLSGKTLYEKSIRLRIHGRGTRAYPEKSFRIMPDSIRGDTVIRYRFFEDLSRDSFKKILLRNLGNELEWPMDAMLQQTVKGLWPIIQEYAPAVVYINGNYWGIHNFKEKPDEQFLADKYGAPLGDIELLNYHRKLELQYGDIQSLLSFEELIEYIQKNSMSDEKAYQHVCTQMDINNFIDYMIIETFFANFDWGYNNIRLYRVKQQTDSMKEKNIEAGKWRWLLFDLDAGMFKSPSYNMFNILKERFYCDFITPMFFSLLDNTGFKEQFLKRYDFVINNYFTTEKMIQQIDIFEAQYQFEIRRHIARWQTIEGMRFWQSTIAQMKEFARKRSGYVFEQLKAL